MMKPWIYRFVPFFIFGLALSSPGSLQKPDALLSGINQSVAKGNYAQACDYATSLLASKDLPASLRTSLLRSRGGWHFRMGNLEGSAADFDQLLKDDPQTGIQLWERGITCYYLGRYADGTEQFARYQEYYSNDVENAVWRYLCQEKVDGKKKARADILPIEHDRRIPMMQVYALFKGAGTAKDIEAAVAAAPKPGKHEARFMADLYLGLWFHSENNSNQANIHIDRAAAAYKNGHYMWATAVQHQQLLKQPAGKPSP